MKTIDRPWTMVCMWVDRKCQYFISTASSLKEDKAYSHWQYRQPELSLDNLDFPNNQDTARKGMTVLQPEVCQICFDVC